MKPRDNCIYTPLEIILNPIISHCGIKSEKSHQKMVFTVTTLSQVLTSALLCIFQYKYIRDWSLITGRGLQNGKIAGPKLFAPPPPKTG